MALSFAFDASAETPQSTATKRALIAQIMGSSKTPRNIGEGFSALGDGIVANVLGGRAAEAEKAGQASANDTFSQLVASISGQGGATPSYGPATASDAAATLGSDFMSGLVNSESGGNWQALNDEGYGGRLQFGDARLADAAAAGIIPAGMTGADFSMMPPEVQQAVENWHFGDIDQQAANMGLNQYFGQTVGGVPINADSVRAMAHLGGIGGVQKFIASGGQYNPADSNGTRLSDYGTRFGGTAATQVAQGPDLAMLMEAASNPWLSDSQKSVINSMIAQQMQQQDPAYQLGLEKLGLEVEGMRNPQPDPGFRVLTAEEAAKMNLPEGAYQVGPDNKVYEIGGGGTNVNVNLGDGAPGLGKLSTDYGYVLDPATSQPKIDPTTGLPTAAPVPGSPAAIAAQQAADAAAQGVETEGTYADIVTEDIGRALTLLEQDPTFTTGMFGVALGNWKGSNADRLDQLLNTVRSNVAFDRLQLMRESSPTGGALGSVTENELKLLESAIGSLERSNPDDLAYNLKRVQEIYDRVMQKAAAYPNASQFGFGGNSGPSPGQSGPVDIDALLEKYQ